MPGCSEATSIPRPAKFSLAHHGVLFLDELPEFKRSVLETARQPLEEGRVTISRAPRALMTFPSEFMLIAAMNPTPDGKMPGESRSSPREIQNYLGRISGPLLDRIDLHIEVPLVKFRDLAGQQPGETSAQVRERVVAARRRQQTRFASKPKITCNASMGSRELKAHCALDEATLELLKFAMSDMHLSARVRPHPQSRPDHRRPRRFGSHYERPHLRSHPIPLARPPNVELRHLRSGLPRRSCHD